VDVTVVAEPRRGASPVGRILVPLLVILAALVVAVIAGTVTGIIPGILAWGWGIGVANVGIVRFAVAIVAILLYSVATAFVVILFELKVFAFITLRIGPNRVGPWGILSSVFHGFKVLSKEDFTPTGVDVRVFTLAPVVTFLATVMVLLVLPFGPGLIGQDMNIALLYFFAMGGLTVVGLLMAGWSSYNKFSLLGGLRSAAQMVTYEIPLTLSVVGIVMLAGTMSLQGIVSAQSGSFLDWFVIRQPLAFIIFFLAATAEANRTPFDMSEADQELVGGFATEYSGMRFGFFFFAEYVNLWIVSALTATLFFGGWTAPFGWPWPIVISLDPGSLGAGLLVPLVVVPVAATIVLAVPIRMLGRTVAPRMALLGGFVLFNVLALGAFGLWLAVSFEAVVGLGWFLAKAYFFVFVYCWLRGTLPRIRVDQLMGLAWKWLLPAALVNLFVTALAILVVKP
jgi:NADH-quinone oxidoreductase subunit H